jgi:hypothetical protein
MDGSIGCLAALYDRRSGRCKNAGIGIIVMVSIVRRNLDGVLNTRVTNTVRVEDVSLLALTLRPP